LVDRLIGGSKFVIDLIPEGRGSDFQFVIHVAFKALHFLDSSNEVPDVPFLGFVAGHHFSS
jgi:hypothetical protein